MLGILTLNYCNEDIVAVPYYGYSFKDGCFRDYMINRVKPKLDDEDWNKELLRSCVEGTGYSADKFIDILNSSNSYSNWRIGEAIAECLLEDSGKARFYYNSSRDLKNPDASNTGADLVGFCDIDDETLFLFGEVKTSSSPFSPPSVLYGRTGMIKQLEELQINKGKQKALIKWIIGKQKLLPETFEEDFKKALSAYTLSNENVQFVGVLIRDTIPNELDLKNRAQYLGEKATSPMRVWLFAFYTGFSMGNSAWVSAMNGGVTCEG